MNSNISIDFLDDGYYHDTMKSKQKNKTNNYKPRRVWGINPVERIHSKKRKAYDRNEFKQRQNWE